MKFKLKPFKTILFFSKEENTAILSFIVIVTSLYIFISVFYSEPYQNFNPPSFKKTEKKWEKHHKIYISNKKHPQKFNFFFFDPNTIDSMSFIQMGFTPKQTIVICNYRRKGGYFKKKEDFLKIYSIPSNIKEELQKWIKIEQCSTNIKKFEKKYSKKLPRVNLNTATQEELEALPFIGPNYAKAIVNLRNKVLSYHSVSQIKEIPIIHDSTFTKFKDLIFVDQKDVVTFDVNSATANELRTCKYFNYYTAQKIIKYREINGQIKNIDELISNNIVDSLTYSKIINYLSVSITK